MPGRCRCSGADLPHTRLHDPQPTTATLLLRSGLDFEEVAQPLRHADPTTSLRHYSAALPDRQDAGAAALDRVLAGGI